MSHDYDRLKKELDQAKATLFLGNNSAFYAPLLCSLRFSWREDIKTAATDGKNLYWAPTYFSSLPLESRKTELMHEMEHVVGLHMVRRGTRNPKIWNIACDIKIDLKLEAQGYTFKGINGVPRLKKYVKWIEEDIYDDLYKNQPEWLKNFLDPDHLIDADQATAQAVVSALVQAMQVAKQMKKPGHIPGDLEELVNKFLDPVVPWERELQAFMTELSDEYYSYAMPERRYMTHGLYLPSLIENHDGLTHLAYYQDASGSISTDDMIRFNSEMKYIKEVFTPVKMTLAQFDTKITQEIVFEQSDPYNGIKLKGRGGTSLAPVRAHIEKIRPTAAIIFSDLYCAPMEPLTFNVPILWVCVGNSHAKVNFGKLIHIKG